MNKFVFALILFGALAARAEVIEKIVAVVNDEIITQTDIETYRNKLKGSSLQDELFSVSAEELLKDEKRLVQQIINERLVDSEVVRQNLSVTFERVEEEIKGTMKQNGINRSQLKQALQEQGTTMADYQDFLKKRLERQALISKAITSKIKISDEDVMAYYLAKTGKPMQPSFEYSLAHILIRPRGGNDDAAYERAQLVAKKLAAGEKFEELSEQFSEDPNYQKDGFLGRFRTGEFLKELESAVTSVSEGSYSAITRTKLGFHIIKVLKKTSVPNPEFDKQKEQIRSMLSQKAFEKQFQFWIEQRRQEANIRIN